MLRKTLPYLLFFALGLLMLAGAQFFPQAVTWLYKAAAAPGPAASGAEVAAGQQASGWVPSAMVASKFITFAGAYLLAVLLPWVVQHLTHPIPTRWAKVRYSKQFALLPSERQFAVNNHLQLVNVIRAAAALLFAALVV
ncbi:hypothetical protein GCM10027594_34250 [Hymenobacter agri]